MKLLDKLKDLFVDEIVEDEDVELLETGKEVYKEPKDVLPKVMRENIKEEEIKKQNVVEPVVKKEEVSTKKFNFPIDFEEELPTRKKNTEQQNVNVLTTVKKEKETVKKTSELYPKKEETKPKFKATPVISPVYGILDKNYKKEEVKEKNEDNGIMKRPSKKMDFETVRKKAFGNLADEIKDNLMCENCELYKEVKKISALKEDDLLYDMTIDDNDVTIEKAYDNYEEFGVAYEPKVNNNVKEEEKVEELGKEKVEEEVVIPSRSAKKEKMQEEIIQKEKVEEVKNEPKVDADFFELIDSMYQERDDD